MTGGEESRPTSRPGQYWHVHECRWVRYAETAPAPVVVPEQATTVPDEVPAVGAPQ